jgi:Arc/MetJ-type ribon-helix-helix transcriptional regulator
MKEKMKEEIKEKVWFQRYKNNSSFLQALIWF